MKPWEEYQEGPWKEYQNSEIAPVNPFIRAAKSFSSPLLSSKKILSKAPISAMIGTAAPIYEAISGVPGKAIIDPKNIMREGAEAVSSQTSPLAILSNLAMGRGVAKAISAPQSYDRAISKSIDSGFMKGVRPSLSGSKSFTGIKKLKSHANEAVKTIVDLTENEGAIKLPGEMGEQVARLPSTVEEFSNAIGQAKRNIFTKYDALAKSAGTTENTINVGNINTKLDSISKNAAISIASPEVSNYASGLLERLTNKGTLTLSEAQDLIENFNAKLKAFYKAPSTSEVHKIAVDAQVVAELRKELSDVVSKFGKTADNAGSEYAGLRKKYGSLDAIESDVAKRAFAHGKSPIRGLADFSDILSVGELIRGLSVLDPSMVVKGTGQYAAKEFLKHINNPDRIIKSMFEKVSSIPKKNQGAISKVVRSALVK